MGNDKSILEKISDTVKDIATLATDAASHALKPGESPPKADEQAAAYVPPAADGVVSDPMMVPPVAMAPVAQKHTARRRKAKKASRPAARKAKKMSRTSAAKTTKKFASKKKSVRKALEAARTKGCEEIR